MYICSVKLGLHGRSATRFSAGADLERQARTISNSVTNCGKKEKRHSMSDELLSTSNNSLHVGVDPGFLSRNELPGDLPKDKLAGITRERMSLYCLPSGE